MTKNELVLFISAQGPGSHVRKGLTKIRRATNVFGAKFRGHDGLVNCIRTAMIKSVSKQKTFVAANAIYSHKYAGHNAFASMFEATYEESPAII